MPDEQVEEQKEDKEEQKEVIDPNDPKYAGLPGWEVEELIEVTKWREKMEAGEEIPDPVRKLLEATDMDLDQLLSKPPDRQLSSWIKTVIPDARSFTITTEDACVMIQYSPAGNRSDVFTYPINEDGRLHLSSIDLPDPNAEEAVIDKSLLL